MTIRDLAREMSLAFESSERNNGEKFRKLRDGSPQWMTDVIRAAHGEMMPDDFRYEFIEAACDALAENDDEDSARDSIEADIYTHDLTRWLASRADRYGYCDQYMEDFGIEKFPGTIELLQGGQRMEREEVFGLVLEALRDLADGSEDDESDENKPDGGPVVQCDECGGRFPDSSDLMTVTTDGAILCPDCARKTRPDLV